MNRLLSDTASRVRSLPPQLSGFRPLIDVYDTGQEVVVRALLPSATPEDIDSSLEHNTLTLRGHYQPTLSPETAKQVTWYRREIGSGEFTERITLPMPVDAEQASAVFEYGVLTLTLPKTAKERARWIPVRGHVEQLAQRELEQERTRRELDSQ